MFCFVPKIDPWTGIKDTISYIHRIKTNVWDCNIYSTCRALVLWFKTYQTFFFFIFFFCVPMILAYCQIWSPVALIFNFWKAHKDFDSAHYLELQLHMVGNLRDLQCTAGFILDPPRCLPVIEKKIDLQYKVVNEYPPPPPPNTHTHTYEAWAHSE